MLDTWPLRPLASLLCALANFEFLLNIMNRFAERSASQTFVEISVGISPPRPPHLDRRAVAAHPLAVVGGDLHLVVLPGDQLSHLMQIISRTINNFVNVYI